MRDSRDFPPLLIYLNEITCPPRERKVEWSSWENSPFLSPKITILRFIKVYLPLIS